MIRVRVAQEKNTRNAADSTKRPPLRCAPVGYTNTLAPADGADLDNGIFERLGRYEAALWRPVRQTLFTLQHLPWRAPRGHYRRTPDRWQRSAVESEGEDEDRADEP
jgi:hypothetical protein